MPKIRFLVVLVGVGAFESFSKCTLILSRFRDPLDQCSQTGLNEQALLVDACRKARALYKMLV